MATRNTGNPYNAGIDANNWPTLTALSGTVGTADTAGTAEIIAIGGNPTTGALYVQDLSGASGTTTVQMVSGTLNVGTVVVSSSSGGTNVNIASGTQQTLGTVNRVEGGTLAVNMLSGTLNVGTTVVSGNVGVSTGTITTGSLTDLANLYNGSVRMTVGTLTTGSLTDLVNLYSGSVRMTVGTLTTGTLQNLVSGTINALASGTITGGTLQNLSTGTITSVANLVGGTLFVGTVVGQQANAGSLSTNPLPIAGTTSTGTLYGMLVDTSGNPQVDVVNTPTVNMASGTLNVGTVVIPTGTITTIAAGTQNTLGTVGVVNNLVTGTLAAVTTVTTVSNLTNGSVNILTGTVTRASNVGTIESGTIQINPDPVPTMLTFGTQGTAGGSFFATISAASGAGTKHFISGVDIVVESGTADVRVLAGSAIQGTGVLAAGKFPPGGGISKLIDPAFETGTNSELIYHFVGAGTAFITVNYWKGT